MQNFKTVVLLAAISGLLIAIGGAMGGYAGVAIAFVIALAMNVGSYWFSADIVLKTSHAHEIEHSDDPDLFRMIETVANAANMPMPRVYIIDSPQPNAFATGRSPKHAAVAVTTGIRRILTDRELRGVIGHEMAHVANRDILTSSVVATIASAISMISFFALWFGDRRNGLALLVVAIVAPIAASVIQLAISRAREYQADTDGANYVSDPEALASALSKLERGAQVIPMDVPDATAHLFIVN
ncbi:MAG: M48 family metalloprotease, partial [Chloroflexi bacterium]|nr:M48 family metalloprotease [Chloroflexota bacterium]